MKNELQFRTLRANEIDVRIGSINKGGVNLLLYKDARADQNILDETVGAMNWQRQHSRDNANCVVSIFDESKQMWISKEDTGVESNTEKEKGLASDSFKRACVNWGIGRELYTAPDIFIYKDNLLSYTYEGDKGRCYDKFVVTNIAYTPERSISAVEIGVLEKGGRGIHYKEVFRNTNFAPASKPQNTNKPTAPAPSNTPANPETPKSATVTVSSASAIADDEVILLGNCRGKRYGDVKDSDTFKSFLRWVACSKNVYTDEKIAEQFRRFKTLALA